MNNDSQEEITYVDLFAGIGGFAAAFEAMGLKNRTAVEFDKDAANTYKRFWGHEAFGDVTELAPDVEKNTGIGIERHSILSAGFPCQPFSKSGAQLGVLDKSRGTLFHNVLNAIQTGQPTIVILENVKNLAGPKHSKDLGIIKESLVELGYRVSMGNTFVSPHRIPRGLGGRPQSRERIFITATRVPSGIGEFTPGALDVYSNFPPGWSPDKWDLEADHLDAQANRDHALKITPGESTVLHAWDDLIQTLRRNSVGIPGFPMWTEYWREGETDTTQMPKWKTNFITKNRNFYLSNRGLIEAWLLKHEIRTHSAFNPSKRKFEWQAQDMRSVFDGIVHFRPSGVRVKKATYLPALVAITQTPIVAKHMRRLSVSEAANLQGFPKSFNFDHQSEAKSFKQLGNGVNIGVVWWVLKTLARKDKDLLSQTPEGERLLTLISQAPDNPDIAIGKLSMQGRRQD